MHVGLGEWDDDVGVRAVRHRVRQKLRFYRSVAYFVVIVGALAIIDWATGPGWWVQSVAAIWGGILFLRSLNAFVAPNLWGPEAESG